MPDEPGAKPDLDTAVDGFLDSMRTATEKMTQAAAAVPVAPVAPAPPVEPLSKERLDAAGSTGEALELFAREGLMPVVMDTNTKLSNVRKESAEKDAQIGPLMKRYSKEIAAEATKRGGVLHTAEHGFESLALEIAYRDPKYRQEIVDAEVTKKLAEEKATEAAAAAAAAATPGVPAPSVPAPAVEGVHAGPVAPAAPAAAPTEEQEIAKIEVSDEDVEFNREAYGLKKEDIQRQRWEIAREYKKRGALGIQQLGGMPVCSLAAVGIPEPDEELDQTLRGKA